MRNPSLILIFSFFASGLFAQEQKYNIVFKPEQTAMGEQQKKELNFIASRLMEGESVLLYPLAYDSLVDVYKFTSQAKLQAQAISEYANSIGFVTTGFPHNFPSGYSGMSVGIVLKFTKPIDPSTLANNGAKGQGLFPEKPSQYFLINPLKDTLIVGKEGTRLLFKAGCLLSTKKVQIELKEYYQLGDYIKSALPTVSNGQMLQTGGSIYLDARENDANKKQVKINPQIGVQVDFTLGKNDADMQVFIKDPRTPNALNWILPSRRVTRESWEITETVLDADGKVVSEQKFNSKEEWDKHLEEKERKKKEMAKAAEIKETTRQKMDSKLQIYDLGYINCDKFYNEPTLPLIVAADAKYNAQYYVVYTDIRGVLKGESHNGTVTFGSLAKNREAVLIAVSFVDKQAYFFKCKIGIGGKLEQKIALSPMEESALNQELALLK